MATRPPRRPRSPEEAPPKGREAIRVTTRKPAPEGDQTRETVPRLPHEKDESTDAAPLQRRGIMRRAAADIAEGQEDTDCRADATKVFNDKAGR